MSKKPKNYLAVLIDKSGSMMGYEEATVNSYNEQLQLVKSKSKDVKTKATVVTFNHDINRIIDNRNAKNIDEMSRSEYRPTGMTSLYDALKETIEYFDSIDDVNDNTVLFTIITDGHDTSSITTAKEIAELIQKHQEKDKWTFTYIGTDHDLSVIHDKLNIPKSNIMKFAKSALGFKSATDVRAYAHSSYYDKIATGIDKDELRKGFFSSEDKILDLDEDKKS